MPRPSDSSRELWLWLFHDGGAWTAHDLAKELDRDVKEVFFTLQAMCVRGVVEKFKPEAGGRKLRYAVTGTCLVPQGMRVAEVQQDDAVAPGRDAKQPRRAETYPQFEGVSA